MHLRSVLKDTPALGRPRRGLAGRGRARRLVGRRHGAVPTPWSTPGAAPSPSGLGVIAPLAFVPHADTWTDDKPHRTLSLAPAATPVVGIDERTA